MNILVSIIMATYNETAEIVKKAIDSVLQQSYGEFELLIIDDSTEAETIEVIDSFESDSRVKVFRENGRLGFVKSLNLGLRNARGKYIARMDGDDIALPNRLDEQVKFLEANKDIYVVGGQINIIDENDNIISSRKYPLNGWKLYLFSTVRNPLAHPTVMMKKELVDIGFCYDEELKMSEDLDLWLRLMNKSYKIANIPATVLNYRVPDNFAEKRSNWKQVEYMAAVRRKNFSKRHFIHSVLSCISAGMFLHTPTGIIKRIYKKENKQ